MNGMRVRSVDEIGGNRLRKNAGEQESVRKGLRGRKDVLLCASPSPRATAMCVRQTRTLLWLCVHANCIFPARSAPRPEEKRQSSL